MKNQTSKKFVTRLPHETLEKVQASNNVKDRVKILQEDATFALKTILQVNFREDITFDFPEGAPPYKKDESNVPGQQYRSIEKSISSLKNLVAQNKAVPTFKKEAGLIRLLESVHPKDAEILIAMKDKDLKSLYKGITLSTVQKAFPNLKLVAE
jgi:hypothetical protein